MNRLVVPALILTAVAIVLGVDLAQAKPMETFVLEEHDRLIAESPGCYAQCTAQGTRRTCTVRSMDCKVICTSIAECKPDGLRPIKVCAVVKEGR